MCRGAPQTPTKSMMTSREKRFLKLAAASTVIGSSGFQSLYVLCDKGRTNQRLSATGDVVAHVASWTYVSHRGALEVAFLH